MKLNLENATYQLAPVSTRGATAIELLQITDTHLFKEENGKLLGLNTRKSYQAILDAIKDTEKPDIILATGDLAQDASSEAYHYLSATLSELNTATFWIPGNHDNPGVMAQSMVNKNVYSQKRILIQNWQIVLLDTSVKGKVYGQLSDEQLDFMHACLSDKRDRNALIALHHQPINVGSQWLDKIGLKNSAEFFAVLARHPQVRGVMWGHVHQNFEQDMGSIKLFSTPSTCVQFQPQSADFEAGMQDPGYRRVTLNPDGSIQTEVVNIRPLEFKVDYSIRGY